MQKLNRQAVTRYRAAVASAGSLMFDATASASQGRSELIAEQVLLRVQADAKTQAANSLNLGALVNTSV
jgi:hypothetical protein